MNPELLRQSQEPQGRIDQRRLYWSDLCTEGLKEEFPNISTLRYIVRFSIANQGTKAMMKLFHEHFQKHAGRKMEYTPSVEDEAMNHAFTTLAAINNIRGVFHLLADTTEISIV